MLIGWSVTRRIVPTTYGAAVLALTLDSAQNIALLVIVGLIVLAVAAAWLMKALVAKLIIVTVLGLLAFAVWSNRSTLQDCADNVVASVAAGTSGDTECDFFGFTVTIPDPTG